MIKALTVFLEGGWRCSYFGFITFVHTNACSLFLE